MGWSLAKEKSSSAVSRGTLLDKPRWISFFWCNEIVSPSSSRVSHSFLNNIILASHLCSEIGFVNVSLTRLSLSQVQQFAGYVGEHSAYHHGEANLAGTIIGMAQNFVGSNNINLLSPEGQFGTREQVYLWNKESLFADAPLWRDV